MIINHFLKFFATIIAGLLVSGLYVSQAFAQNIEPDSLDISSGRKSIFENVWKVPRLYESNKNKVIQEFSLIGRYHGQYWSVKANEESESGWENRRIYIGAEAMLFQNFTLHLQIKVSEDLNPFYEGLYQAFLKWTPSKVFSVSAGRLDFLYTGLERTVSSNRIVTFERNLLTNQLLPHEVVGAVAQGKSGYISWHAGILSGNILQEFTNFSGGYGVVAGVGYELPLIYKEGSLHLDYLYNSGHSENNALEPYDHILSLWHQGKAGPFSMGIELIAGHGIEGQKSVFGFTILPTLLLGKNIIFKGDALEAVLRYHYATSNGPNGLIPQQRYEQKVMQKEMGDNYNAMYAGVNWLIYETRFKLMTGVEYSSMNDSEEDGGRINSWTYLAGVRVYF
jgi:phosphate-selective porin OprO/OprP